MPGQDGTSMKYSLSPNRNIDSVQMHTCLRYLQFLAGFGEYRILEDITEFMVEMTH